MFIFMLSCPAFSEAKVDIYKNNNYDLSNIKSVLMIPVNYDITIPTDEAFFTEKVAQKWVDLIKSSKENFSFLLKSPEDIISRDDFVTGETRPNKLSLNQTLEKALSLSDQYVDAIMSVTITQSNYTHIHHSEELIWRTRNERRTVKIDGKWRDIVYPVRYREIKPAWNETYANASLKIEIRDSKTNELIYGISATAKTGAGFFTPTPSLTTEVCNVMEYAVKRMDLK